MSLSKHRQNCICKACSAARLAKPTPPDSAQGDIFEAVKTDSAQPSLAGVAGVEPATDCKSAASGHRGSTPRTGIERKEEALTAHDQRRRGTLLWLREELRKLYRGRAAGYPDAHWRFDPYVTADDAELLLRKHPEKDPGGGGSWKGAIFRGANWQFTGKLIPSVIAENNGRGQRAWRYVGP